MNRRQLIMAAVAATPAYRVAAFCRDFGVPSEMVTVELRIGKDVFDKIQYVARWAAAFESADEIMARTSLRYDSTGILKCSALKSE